ncbi:MAG TPA: EamA family transporter [Solirubrobacteraceae bacterium]|jgi:drug/metabolite transporter (DMT)-like permease|nr:EamA family transporter [Solirubrobacteraceae bacterium]
MSPVVAGLAAACGFAVATVGVSRLSVSIGTGRTVSATMALGFVTVAVAAAVSGPPPHVGASTLFWLACAGIASLAGFALASAAFRYGGLAVTVPVISTEGAIAAIIAVAAGERLRGTVAAALVVVALGVLLATRGRDADAAGARDGTRSILLAMACAVVLGLSLYSIGHVSNDVPVVWVILPSRVAGFFLFALPNTVSRSRGSVRRARLRISDLAWIVFAEAADLAGLWLYTLGARHSIAVTAVIAAQASPLAVAFACVFLKERLTRMQTIGFAVITAGVVVVTLAQQ